MRVTEKRAQAFCEDIKTYGRMRITVEWKRSATWGANPVIESSHGKMTHVSGCGYCKESTALSEVFRWLWDKGTDEHNAIWATGGCGVPSVQEGLSKLGWDLEQLHCGKNEHGYIISRKDKQK